MFLWLFRTIESLYEELASEGVLMRCQKVRISEFVGEFGSAHMHTHTHTRTHLPLVHVTKLNFKTFPCSYLSTMLRTAGVEPMPSLSDVRRVVTEYCILPMGKPLLFS